MGDTYIEFYTGMLGGFKTYSSVLRVVPHLAQGGHVYSNVEYFPEEIDKYIRRKFGVEVHTADQIHFLTSEQMREFPDYIASGTDTCPVLLVCDEAHLLWPNTEWAAVAKKIMQFITLTRKFSVHMILISQAPENVAKQFRRLVQFYWTFRDLRKMRLSALNMSFKWLPFYHASCFDVGSKTVQRSDINVIDPSIFRLYQTRQIVLPMAMKMQLPANVRRLTWDEMHPYISRKYQGARLVEWMLASLAILIAI